MHEQQTLQLNKAHWPVTVLGPGRRIGLWVQGCTIRCRGCVSQDTWPRDPAKAIAVRELLAWCRRVAPRGPDGVTISGGEPFEQPAALRALLTGLHGWRRTKPGLRHPLLQRPPPADSRAQAPEAPGAARCRDPGAVRRRPAAGPRVAGFGKPAADAADRARACALRGVRRRPGRRGRQADAGGLEGGRVWLIGIPGRGDMAVVESLCASRGLALKQVSWRR